MINASFYLSSINVFIFDKLVQSCFEICVELIVRITLYLLSMVSWGTNGSTSLLKRSWLSKLSPPTDTLESVIQGVETEDTVNTKNVTSGNDYDLKFGKISENSVLAV